jgi:hypothetical protein
LHKTHRARREATGEEVTGPGHRGFSVAALRDRNTSKKTPISRPGDFFAVFGDD